MLAIARQAALRDMHPTRPRPSGCATRGRLDRHRHQHPLLSTAAFPGTHLPLARKSMGATERSIARGSDTHRLLRTAPRATVAVMATGAVMATAAITREPGICREVGTRLRAITTVDPDTATPITPVRTGPGRSIPARTSTGTWAGAGTTPGIAITGFRPGGGGRISSTTRSILVPSRRTGSPPPMPPAGMRPHRIR